MHRPWNAALLLALVALCPALPGSAEELALEEILARHKAARGGEAAWAQVETLTARGSFTAFSEVGPFTLHRQRPDRYFIDQQMGSNRVQQGYDGAKAWWRNPFLGIDWATEAPTADAHLIVQETHFINPLFEAEARGHQVEWVGAEAFEGEDTYHLRVTLAGGGEEHWYLSRDTFLEFARTYTASDFGRPMPGRRYFSDFRPVGELVLPHLIEDEFGTRHRVMEVDAFEVNTDVSEVRFAMPVPAGMEVLAPLEGEWAVTVSLLPFPGARRAVEISGTSAIRSDFDGGLLVEELAYTLQGTPYRFQRHWSYDRFGQRYRLLSYDNFAYHPNLSEGTLEDGVLTLLSTTPWAQQGQPQLERRRVSEIGEEGFTVVEESSSDGGESWQPGATLHYRRPETAEER
jgi:hypothetical protein